MRCLKKAVQRAAHAVGVDIRRSRPPSVGEDVMRDVKSFALPPRPLVLDVGANVGQTVKRIRRELPTAVIHSFEPSPRTFARLQSEVGALPDVHLWNLGLGASVGELVLKENSHAEMSSFLELGQLGWGTVERQTRVPVETVDRFCEREGIEHIDLLKTDTQGFDLEVLRGAERMLGEGRVSRVYCEIIFSAMYKDVPALADTLNLMQRHHYLLVTFYQFSYQQGLASWTDALFVHKSLVQ